MQIKPSIETLMAFQQNPFLKERALSAAIEHFGTQGDGNHFAFVGQMKSTGETALVTHHGSRAPGARLYDKGMKTANGFRELLLSAKVSDRFWNEHNFVFRKSDGLFYHGKGATPGFDGWAEDATDLTNISLNMAEPILIVRGSNAPHSLGFSPHVQDVIFREAPMCGAWRRNTVPTAGA